MKPPAQILTIVFIVIALGLTVWLGRYGGAISVAPVTPDIKKDIPNGFAIQENGPFPKAVIDELSHDFGMALLGSKGSHTFTIRNEGEGPMRVKTGTTSCSQCTLGKVSRNDEIPPGESVEVEVNWEIKASNPMFRQWAEVFTTDPNQQRIELVITGHVDRPLRMLPDSGWVLGDLSPTEPTVVRGALYSAVLDEVTIERFECANPLVTVTWEPLPLDTFEIKSAKVAWSIIVTVATGAPLGPFRESVKLYTSNQKETPTEFQLGGQRFGPIEFKGRGWNSESNAVILGEFPADKGAKVKLNLYVRDLEGELEIQEITQRFNSAQVQVAPTGRVLGKSKMYEVEIVIPPGKSVQRRGADAEKIQFKLNHPDAKEFTFNISYHAI